MDGSVSKYAQNQVVFANTLNFKELQLGSVDAYVILSEHNLKKSKVTLKRKFHLR